MPGIVIAISYEYSFSGEIMRPEYTTKMHSWISNSDLGR